MNSPEHLSVRAARPEDAPRLLEIYAPYVRDTAITFEYKVPEIDEFRRRMDLILNKYPYLVAESEGRVLGYAYTSRFHVRDAYQWSAETAIYLDMRARGRGIGRKLYDALEKISKAQGILNLNACISCPAGGDAHLTNESPEFHAHMGYTLVGRFHHSGYKFGTWYDMIWMEKLIGPHGKDPAPVTDFNDLPEDVLFSAGLSLEKQI